MRGGNPINFIHDLICLFVIDKLLNQASFGAGGVRLDFREPVRITFLRPPALYLTVQDLEGFAAALAAHGIPGSDARTSRSSS